MDKGQVTALWDEADPIPESELSHNRIKNRVLQEGKAIPYLVKLGISDPNGRIYDKKQDKYRQINKFLQYLQEESDFLLQGKESIRAMDFGCGKSYLTFALHDYLTRVLGVQTDFIGLDLKEDVITTCQKTAEELGLQGIRFIQGDINQFAPLDQVDLTVSLHACDTATDAALAQAVKSHSRLILSVPCCHHELAGQIHCPPVKPILEHGILKQRLAEISTDALRAKWDKGPDSARARRAYQEYQEIKSFLGVDPSLEHMLERADCNR